MKTLGRCVFRSLAPTLSLATSSAAQKSPQKLPEVVVAETEMRLDLAEFERRRARGIGRFLDRQLLAEVPNAPISQVLRARVSRLTFIPICASHRAVAMGGGGAIRLLREPDKFVSGCRVPDVCYLQVYVDGVRRYARGSPGLPFNIDEVRTDQVEAIEVYAGGAETPSQYGGSQAACGTLLLWMRRD